MALISGMSIGQLLIPLPNLQHLLGCSIWFPCDNSPITKDLAWMTSKALCTYAVSVILTSIVQTLALSLKSSGFRNKRSQFKTICLLQNNGASETPFHYRVSHVGRRVPSAIGDCGPRWVCGSRKDFFHSNRFPPPAVREGTF